MTIREFFKELPTKGWTFEGNGIRFKKNGCCPVVAVARRHGFHKIEATDHHAAAVKIGMRIRTANRIATASDTHLNDLVGAAAPLRNRLLRVCGLEG